MEGLRVGELYRGLCSARVCSPDFVSLGDDVTCSSHVGTIHLMLNALVDTSTGYAVSL
jgi:hypothetical protein